MAAILLRHCQYRRPNHRLVRDPFPCVFLLLDKHIINLSNFANIIETLCSFSLFVVRIAFLESCVLYLCFLVASSNFFIRGVCLFIDLYRQVHLHFFFCLVSLFVLLYFGLILFWSIYDFVIFKVDSILQS